MLVQLAFVVFRLHPEEAATALSTASSLPISTYICMILVRDISDACRRKCMPKRMHLWLNIKFNMQDLPVL